MNDAYRAEAKPLGRHRIRLSRNESSHLQWIATRLDRARVREQRERARRSIGTIRERVASTTSLVGCAAQLSEFES
jgi:hypothetical protein